MSIRLIHGDCRDVLATLPAESVHCCVTSPPYFGLRDYGTAGTARSGLEPTAADGLTWRGGRGVSARCGGVARSGMATLMRLNLGDGHATGHAVDASASRRVHARIGGNGVIQAGLLPCASNGPQ